MFSTALIVFRETLEAALLISIIATATRGLLGQLRWLSAGVGVGVLGALILALLAEHIASWADGLGQDMLNLIILSLAFVALAWHSVWSAKHGKEMVQDAHHLGHAVKQGGRTPWALTLAVALAVLREGAETVLFVAGATNSTEHSTQSLMSAVALGLLGGALLGVLLYAGLTRLPIRRVFTVTNVLILLLAASIASQIARVLAQAGWVDLGSGKLWDVSGILPQDSVLGTVAHALLGYDAKPSVLQGLFYLGAIVLIALCSRGVARQQVAAKATPAIASPIASP